MNILHAYIDFDPLGGGGGVARHIHGLSLELVKAGHAVRIVAQETEPFQGKYQVFRLTWARLIDHIRWADVVHVHGARKLFPFLTALAAFVGRRPVVYTPYCYYDDPKLTVKQLCKLIWDRSAELLLLSRSDAVILLCDHWRGYLKQRQLPVSRTTVVPNCVVGADLLDLLPTHPPPPLAGNPSILSVGRLDPVKRLEDVIHALEGPGMSEAVFHIVGKGPDAERLKGEAQKGKVADRVVFHGFVPDREVAAMARGAAVFALPSFSEGQPTVLIEMLLLGVPVVCSRIPGNTAITDVAQLDCTFEVGDVEALRRILLKFAGQPVADAVRDRVVENFTWERVSHRIEALYREENKCHAKELSRMPG